MLMAAVLRLRYRFALAAAPTNSLRVEKQQWTTVQT
jgi:hypothetical protein